MSRLTGCTFSFCGVMAMMWATMASGGDWTGWRGSNRDGKSSDVGLLKTWPAAGPDLLWRATAIGKGFSAVAVAQDTVYATGDVGDKLMIFALDGKGQIKWQAPQGPAYTASYDGTRSTPVIDGDKLYLIGGGGKISCHGTADGRQLWQREMTAFGGKPGHWGYAESALVVDNMVIVTPGGKNAMVALDKSTGQDIWRSDIGAAAHYSSAIAIQENGHKLIVQGSGSGLVAVNAKDGHKVWTSNFCAGNTANCPDPAYADGCLFWANGYGKGGICFQVANKDGKWTFTELWRTQEMVCHHGGYVLDRGYIYGNHNAGWSCLELKTGQAKWKNEKGVGKGSLCFADGMLYLFGENGGQAALAAASPDRLAVSGKFKVAGQGPSWAHPVVANGKLYLRYDTNLYCYNVKAK